MQLVDVAQGDDEDVAASGDAVKGDGTEDLPHVLHLGELIAALLLGCVGPHREMLAVELRPLRSAEAWHRGYGGEARGEQ